MGRHHKSYSKKAHDKKVDQREYVHRPKRSELNSLIDAQEDTIDALADNLYENNRHLVFLQMIIHAIAEKSFTLYVQDGDQLIIEFDPEWWAENYPTYWPVINRPYVKACQQ